MVVKKINKNILNVEKSLSLSLFLSLSLSLSEEEILRLV